MLNFKNAWRIASTPLYAMHLYGLVFGQVDNFTFKAYTKCCGVVVRASALSVGCTQFKL